MTAGAGQTFEVGPRDEVQVTLPPNLLAKFCTDKPLLVRPADGGSFELHPPCKVFEQGGVVPAKVMGDLNGSGIFYFRAKNKDEMAQLTLTTTRKLTSGFTPPGLPSPTSVGLGSF